MNSSFTFTVTVIFDNSFFFALLSFVTNYFMYHVKKLKSMCLLLSNLYCQVTGSASKVQYLGALKK